MKYLSLLLVGGMAISGVFAESPKNVILFIGDGMSIPQRMVAEEFSRASGKGPLAMNSMKYSATTRTCSADSLITDSAAAATAIACGVKTKNGRSGVDADGKPVFSCAAAAKNAGKKVGIVSNVTITHATPAGFYAHRDSRGDAYGISLDLAASGFDFFAGGGLEVKDATSKKHPEYAKFGDPYENIWKNGYKKIKTKKEFLALKPGCGKICTKFTNEALETAIDITPETDQPTVAELTAKAIEILDNEKGFFLMVEGGRIDWAGHANDAGANLHDVLALDKAVKIALDYQSKHGDTLVVVTGDHETGGMSMGFVGTGYKFYMERLANQTMSVDKFGGKVKKLLDAKSDATVDDLKPLITEAFGLKFEGEAKKDAMVLKKDELAEIEKAAKHDIEFHRSKVQENTKYDGEKRYLLGGVCRVTLSHKCGIGWSSSAHTAMPVLTTASGVCSERFTGFIENTDISKIIKSFYE